MINLKITQSYDCLRFSGTGTLKNEIRDGQIMYNNVDKTKRYLMILAFHTGHLKVNVERLTRNKRLRLINVFTALKGTQFYFLYAITAAAVVPYGGLRSLPVHQP